MEMTRDHLLQRLVDLQYTRNDIEFTRGQFRVRGRYRRALPGLAAKTRLRVEFFGEEIERITRFEPLTGDNLESLRGSDHLSRQTIRDAGGEIAPGAARDSRRIGGTHCLV